MPIPEQPFKTFLAAMTPSAPGNDSGWRALRLPGSTLFDRGRRIQDPDLQLFVSEADVQLTAVVGRIRSELRHAQHVNSELMATAILMIVAKHPPNSRYDRLVEAIDAIRDCSVTHTIVLPGLKGTKLSRIGAFTVGLLDADKLRDRCVKAGSDYHERYGNELRGGFAVERDPAPARVIPWDNLHPPPVHDEREIHSLVNLVDRYFGLLAASLADLLWTELEDLEKPAVAIGEAVPTLSGLRESPHERISIFWNVSDRGTGWVAPFRTTPQFLLNQRLFHKNVEAAETARAAIASSEREAARDLVEFLHHAARLEQRGQLRDAFLNRIIALEIAFGGGRQDLTKTIARRIAALTSNDAIDSYNNRRSSIENLYGSRSRLVHGGVAPNEKVQQAAASVCTEAAKKLLAVLRGGRSRDAVMKDLDCAATLLEAGRELPESLRRDLSG